MNLRLLPRTSVGSQTPLPARVPSVLSNDSPVSDLCLPVHLLATSSPPTLLPEWVNNLSPIIPNISDSDSSISIASSDSLSNPEHRPTNEQVA